MRLSDFKKNEDAEVFLKSVIRKEIHDTSLQYAIHKYTKELIHIDDAKNGLACDCVCPSPDCNMPLMAIHPTTSMKNHYRHFGGCSGSRFGVCANPEGANETVLHKLVKEYIGRVKVLMLPAYYFQPASDPDGLVYPPVCLFEGGSIHFDKVVLEQSVGDYRPDCIGYINDRRIMIEVCVHHKVDSNKREKVERSNESMVEIYLKTVPQFFDISDVEKAVENTENIRWICCPYLEEKFSGRIDAEINHYRQRWELKTVECLNRKELDARKKYTNDSVSALAKIEYGHRKEKWLSDAQHEKEVIIRQTELLFETIYKSSVLSIYEDLLTDLKEGVSDFVSDLASDYQCSPDDLFLSEEEFRSLRERVVKELASNKNLLPDSTFFLSKDDHARILKSLEST